MKITEIKVVTGNLYAWGQGFMHGGQAQGWDDFWRKYAGICWNAVADETGSVFLVGVYGGGMIHPMDFTLSIRQDLQRSRSDISELDRAMRKLAKKLDFTYSIQVRETVVDDNQDFWRMFSTDSGVVDAPPGRVGVTGETQDVTYGQDSTGDALSCGKAPYVADLVSADGKQTRYVDGEFDTEEDAVKAVIEAAKKHGMVSPYTRHWVTSKGEHMVDYGSHAFYGRITSKGKYN